MGLVLPDDWEKARSFLKTSMRNLRHDVDQLLRRPVENQPTLSGQPQATETDENDEFWYRVNAQCRAGQSANGTLYQWNGSAYAPTSTTSSLVMPDNTYGYHFNGDLVLVKRVELANPSSGIITERLEIRSAGVFYVRGTLAGQLASGGSATLNINVGSSGRPQQSITVFAPFTFTGTAILSGKIIGASWNQTLLVWDAVARQCN